MKRIFLYCTAIFLIVSTSQLRSVWFDLNFKCQNPQVWFVDKNNGWLGCWKSGFNTNTIIFFSTNGGETWDTSLKVWKYTEGISLFSDIYFYNKKYGWLLDWGLGLLWRTTDSGKTWSSSQCGYGAGMLGKLSFVDSLYGWIAYLDGYIDKTTDGGETFIHLVKPDFSIPDSLREIYRDVFFVNRNLGWVVGRLGGNLLIKKTTDGGLSWANFVNSNLSGTPKAVFFIDSINGWAVGTKGLVLKTTDGGENWERDNLSLNEALTLWDIRFLNSNVGYIVGEGKWGNEYYGLILRTDDGGKTWLRQYSPVKDYCTSICIVDSLTAWITGSYTLIKTTNGGYLFPSAVSDEESLKENEIIAQPFSDEFWITFDDDFKEATLLLFNSLGELLFQREIRLSEIDKKYCVEARYFPSGMYFLVVRSNQKTKVHKLILLR